MEEATAVLHSLMEVRNIGRSVMQALQKAEDRMKLRHDHLEGVHGWATRARKALEADLGAD